jgi:hypothetical protein
VVSLITIISRYKELNLNKRFIFWNVSPGCPLKVSTKPVANRAYSSALKIEAACSSETSGNFQRTARHYIPEERTLYDAKAVRTWNRRFARTELWAQQPLNTASAVSSVSELNNTTFYSKSATVGFRSQNPHSVRKYAAMFSSCCATHIEVIL